jgi:multidrug resistance efflux pump
MSFLRHIARFLVTIVMVAIALILGDALWRAYMLAPWTRDGRVQVQVVDIAPEVGGTVVAVPVADNQFVHRGDVLFVIDPVRFRLAIAQAQSQYNSAKQQQQQRESDSRRRRGLSGLVSAEEQETSANTAAVAGTALMAAQASLDVAKLNLARSTLYAPVDGFISHLRLRVGDYATAGAARLTVIDASSFWISGYFEETKLAQIRIGDLARVKLMGYDATIAGHVESIGRGIADTNDAIAANGLPSVNPVFTWVRLAQRIPVRIAIDKIPPGIVLAAGMTASVSVGSDAHPHATPRGKLLRWVEDNL